MQVVILAGGIGSRLSPWTKSVPKPLLPMLDRTLLEQVIYSIPHNIVDEVIVAGGYKVEMIKSYFDAFDCGFDISIVNEQEPLGTGGALSNCRELVSGTFACFNGDIVSSLNVNELLSLHKANGGIGTLGLWEVEDPTRYGIVGLDSENKITKFLEKPAKSEVFSNLINAGSYIFEDDIFDCMPKGKHSLERDVFPNLTEPQQLNGMAFEGYFIDAGTRDSWCQAVAKCVQEKRFDSGMLSTNSWFGDSLGQVGDSKVINSMIESKVTLDNCIINNSTILAGSTVSKGCIVENSLIGKNCTIGENSVIKNMIVGHSSKIAKGTIAANGIWPIGG